MTAGGFRFLLESDCVDGRCAKVEVLAIGAGYAYGPKRLKVTGTTGGVTLWDELHSPDPDVFNGQFYYASAGWAFAKMGQGVSFLRLGAATGDGKPGVLEGVDATIGFLIGSSTVLDYHFEPCCQ